MAGFPVTTNMYVDYLQKVYTQLVSQEVYITELDLATGDGDHWSNMNMGFSKLDQLALELRKLNLQDLFKKIGMTMMSVIGGSSGVLYGGAYLAASKTLAGKDVMQKEDLLVVLATMLDDMKKRGKTEPGWKTMIDALHPAVEAFRKEIESGADDQTLLKAVIKAAEDGAESTRNMEAVRGRASYQTNKAVGHLDPGAVTMALQLHCLCETILE